MIVKLDDDIVVNIEKVSFIGTRDNVVVVDGVGLTLHDPKNIAVIKKAFEWMNSTSLYDKNLKRINK